MPSVRNALEHEAERIRDLELQSFHTIAADRPAEDNAAALAQFMGIDMDTARRLAQTEHLFAD